MNPQTSAASALRRAAGRHWKSLLERLRRWWQALDLWIDARFGDDLGPRYRALIQDFKTDADAIEEGDTLMGAHAALFTVLALLVLAVLGSIFASVDRIVVAPGKIATRTPVIVLQPFSTSRIMEIAVKPGDHVRKGQMLVRFDPAFAEADEQSLKKKVATLEAEADRLQAEISGTENFVATAADGEERWAQTQIFNQEMSEFAAEIAVRDNRIREIQAQLDADTATVGGLKRQLAMANKIVAVRKYLLSQNASGTLDVMKAESDAIDANVHLQSTLGDISKLVAQRAEEAAERQSALGKWRSDHNERLVQVRQDLAEAGETLSKASHMADFTRLSAPADSVVLEIADRSVGSVMREGETLVTLVPDSAELYVQANIASRDISYIKSGEKVRIKLEAYPFQRYGTLSGRLDVISADSVPLKQDAEHSDLVYQAQVPLTESPRDLLVRGISLRPGLVATAEITTGKRSIASYILNPILRTADESVREP
ncbi:MAG TPA: HlyD family type I secretion periplasmic adaptor subunit [Rhizomicrobium sp.]|nr:HlyD family type I secretion periplasmic adaptor subunit [Rhizomicrobium sp.]